MSATLEIPLGIHGLDLTVSLFPDGSDTAVLSNAALTEATNRLGLYTAAVTGLTGLHLAIIKFTTGTVIAQSWVLMMTSGVCVAEDSRSSAFPGAAICDRIADHVRRRHQSNVEASAYGDSLSVSSEYGFIQQAQESSTVPNPGSLTIFKTDGTTELGQKTLTSDVTSAPVTGIS